MRGFDPTDFLFAGAAILPPFLFLADQLLLAVLVHFGLLVAGGLAALGDPEAPFRKPRR